MPSFVSSITNWQFLQEPAYRWWIFLGMILLFLISWRAILRHM